MDLSGCIQFTKNTQKTYPSVVIDYHPASPPSDSDGREMDNSGRRVSEDGCDSPDDAHLEADPFLAAHSDAMDSGETDSLLLDLQELLPIEDWMGSWVTSPGPAVNNLKDLGLGQGLDYNDTLLYTEEPFPGTSSLDRDGGDGGGGGGSDSAHKWDHLSLALEEESRSADRQNYGGDTGNKLCLHSQVTGGEQVTGDAEQCSRSAQVTNGPMVPDRLVPLTVHIEQPRAPHSQTVAVTILVPSALAPTHLSDADRTSALAHTHLPDADRTSALTPTHLPDADRTSALTPTHLPGTDRTSALAPTHLPDADRTSALTPTPSPGADRTAQRHTPSFPFFLLALPSSVSSATPVSCSGRQGEAESGHLTVHSMLDHWGHDLDSKTCGSVEGSLLESGPTAGGAKCSGASGDSVGDSGSVEMCGDGGGGDDTHQAQVVVSGMWPHSQGAQTVECPLQKQMMERLSAPFVLEDLDLPADLENLDLCPPENTDNTGERLAVLNFSAGHDPACGSEPGDGGSEPHTVFNGNLMPSCISTLLGTPSMSMSVSRAPQQLRDVTLMLSYCSSADSEQPLPVRFSHTDVLFSGSEVLGTQTVTHAQDTHSTCPPGLTTLPSHTDTSTVCGAATSAERCLPCNRGNFEHSFHF
ncbi:uncharacterized protein LOC143280945 [Babylonia areolata]|uniref:uncharacterized protein LOC143280945 n=1 Tax=Babylonia areolata TaxID=304850 RepID=UPI003FD6908B